MKRIAIIFAVLSILLAPGCTKTAESEYTRYTDSFFDTFDTLVIVTAYTKSEAEFKAYFELIKGRFQELHRLYDIYNSYEGINNLKTINDRAGQETVEVEQEIIDLILFAKEAWADSWPRQYRPGAGAADLAPLPDRRAR